MRKINKLQEIEMNRFALNSQAPEAMPDIQPGVPFNPEIEQEIEALGRETSAEKKHLSEKARHEYDRHEAAEHDRWHSEGGSGSQFMPAADSWSEAAKAQAQQKGSPDKFICCA